MRIEASDESGVALIVSGEPDAEASSASEISYSGKPSQLAKHLSGALEIHSGQ